MRNKLYYWHGFVLVFSFLSFSCNKWNLAKLPAIKTNSPQEVNYNSAKVFGEIVEDGGDEIIDLGFCWSIMHNPQFISDSTIHIGVGQNSFSAVLPNLVEGTKYFYRAYGINSVGIIYGSEDSFITFPSGLPIVKTIFNFYVTENSVECGDSLIFDGGNPIDFIGICWDSTQHPTKDSPNKLVHNKIDKYSLDTISNLKTGIKYYIRAFASNSSGTSYGEEYSFYTFSGNLSIGSSFAGGKIAYVLQSGDPGYIVGETHGLIVAPSDQSTGMQWGCFGTSVGNTSTSTGTGAANTGILSAACGAGTAARLCADLELGGYSDWYLPSKDELYKIFLNSTILGGFNEFAFYWSSSEYDANIAWSIGFYSGEPAADGNKYRGLYVRAVRSF